MSDPSVPRPLLTGLILSGNSARVAYQVDAPAAVADPLPGSTDNLFPVIVSTSAGVINAVGSACGALQFRQAIQRLTAAWRKFRTECVYRSDWSGMTHQALRLLDYSLFSLGRRVPVALLDDRSLHKLLTRGLSFSGAHVAVHQRQLRAVAVTASGYEPGQVVISYQGHTTIDPWVHHRCLGIPIRLELRHLLTSAMTPLLFPSMWISREYSGDGTVHSQASTGPVLHLGAMRVLVIDVDGNPATGGDSAMTGPPPSDRPPSLAQTGAHLLNSTFTNSPESDIEQLQRMNQIDRLVASEVRRQVGGLEPVEILLTPPSRSLDEVAARHYRELSRVLRLFPCDSGTTHISGVGISSYLLFKRSYCSELIEPGYYDVTGKRTELERLLRIKR